MRVLFFMRNFSGYFRQFEPVLEGMLERGHEVRIARDRKDDMRGEEWAEALAARYPELSFAKTPPARTDRWYELKRELRLTGDYLQFAGPEWDPENELARRARERAPERVVALSERAGAVMRRPGAARRLTRGVHALEAATPSSRAIRRYIRATDPDVVLLTPHLMPGSLQTEYLRAAADLGLPTALCVASWDNLSSKQLIRVVPDVVTVWNDVQRREAMEIHGLPADRIVVTGAQVYDHWFAWPTSPRGTFAARVGLPPDPPYVLYVAGALFPAELTEAEWCLEWLRALRGSPDPRLREIGVLVRPHPKRYAEWSAVDLDALGPIALWPQEGRMPVDRAAKQDFHDSIAHSAGVVGVNTSAMIEAGIGGKRVHTVLVPAFSGSQHGTLHFRYLTESGGGLLRVASTLEEHLGQLAESVRAGGADGAANRAFLEAFVRPQGLDKPSTPLFVDAIEGLAARGPGPRARPRPSRLALRLAMRPLGAAMRARGHLAYRRAKRRVAAARRTPGVDAGRRANLIGRMAKTKNRSPIERATVRLRGGSDLERRLYVTARKALAPRTTIARTRAARADGAVGAIEIPAERGYVMFPPGTFPEAGEVAADAQARLDALGGADAVMRDSSRKQFMIPIVEQPQLDRESPIMRLALREDVLRAVSAYLGTAPLLTNLNVYVSRASERELMSSQLFHCDADDTRQLKVFVLCNEVGEANGPTMIMDAEHSRELRRKVGYAYRDRVSDEEAQGAVGDVALASVTGPTGTVCFVDTSSCFHYGSRVDEAGGPRLAAMIQYLTPYSFMLPRDAAREAPFRGHARPGDSGLVRLALGG